MNTPEWLLLGALIVATIIIVRLRFVKPWRAVRRDLEKLAGGDHRLPPLTSDYSPYTESATHIRKIAGLLEQFDRRIVEEGLSLQGILSGMREGILIINRSSRITLCNRALMDFFPEVKKFLDRTVLEVFRRHEMQHAVEENLRTARAKDIELSFDSSPSGPCRILRIHISAITAEKEVSPRAAIMVFQDVTDVRALEAVRREFLANVSHEFRTPLTIVNGYVETLRDGEIDDPDMAQKSLEAIHRNVRRLSLLLEDLLDISTLENRARPLDCLRSDLRETAERVVEHLAPRISERNAAVVIEWTPEARFAEVDPSRIEQVFSNLLANALQHGESPRLEVRFEGLRQGDEILMTVSDNGPGIPLEDQAHIFERFYRVHKHRSRDAGGTGLGLSIVKNIVLAHGGTVSVSSTPGCGASFQIRLPIFQTGNSA